MPVRDRRMVRTGRDVSTERTNLAQHDVIRGLVCLHTKTSSCCNTHSKQGPKL